MYFIDHWDLSVTWSDIGPESTPSDERSQSGAWFLNVTIEAEGVIFVVKKAVGEFYTMGSDSTPIPVPAAVIRIGSRDGGNSNSLLKKVSLMGLRIQANSDPSYNLNSIDRLGFLVEHCQQFTMSHVWASLLHLGGIALIGVMDSLVSNCQALWCGRDAEAAADKRYGLAISGAAEPAHVDNPNALRIVAAHLEFCPLLFVVDANARHVDFFGCKFEQSAPARTSPIVFGGVDGTGGRESVSEVSLHGCMFVGSYYNNATNPNPRMITSEQPPFVSVAENTYYGADTQPQVNEYDGAIAWRTHTAVEFIACHFTTPDGRGARWFRGSNTTFSACDFSGCANRSPEPASLDLGDNVVIDSSRFAMASSLDDNFGNGDASVITPAEGFRNDLFRFRGANSSVCNPTIFYPPPHPDPSHRIPGSLITVAGGERVKRNRFIGYRPTNNLAPTPIRYETPGEQNANDRIELDAIFINNAERLAGAPGNPPSVFGRTTATLLSGTYEDFLDAYAGQKLRLFVGWGQEASLTHSDVLVLKNNVSRVAPEKTWLAFERIGGFWLEV